MLNLASVKTQLTTYATGFAQVLLPDLEDVQSVDSAVQLVTLLDTVNTSRTYPVILPDEVTYPSTIYQLIGSDRVSQDGYPILRDDQYLVASYHSAYATIVTLADSVRTALQNYSPSNAAGTVDILDEADDYDADFALFEKSMQIRMVHLAYSSQALPAAFLYPVGEDWDVSDSVGSPVCAQVTSRFVVLMVAKIPAGGVSALGSLRNEILDNVIGYQPSGWSVIEPVGSGLISVYSNLCLWRDEFATTQARTY